MVSEPPKSAPASDADPNTAPSIQALKLRYQNRKRGVSSTKEAFPRETNSSGAPVIQAFKLRAQYRKREPLLINAGLVRKRTQPLPTKKKDAIKRQVSATFSTTSTTTVTTTVTSNVPTSPVVTVTVVEIPSPTLSITFFPGETLTTVQLPQGATTITVQPGESGTVINLPPETSTITAFPQQMTGTVTETVTQSPSPSMTTDSSSPVPTNPLFTRSGMVKHHVPTIVGSVIGGLVALLILFGLCYRRRKRQRATGAVLLADPFQDEDNMPPRMEQPQRSPFARMTAPTPFVPSAFGEAMVANPSSSSSPLSSSFAPGKSRKFVPPPLNIARQDSISTTQSPDLSTSAQDTVATVADMNALRARILEAENLALRQRINDVENMVRAVASGSSTAALRPPRASESPPEYASPIDGGPGLSHA